MRRTCSRFLLTAIGMVGAINTAAADELTLGLGAGLAPEFEGSSDYRFIPFPSLRYQNDLVTIRTRGIGVEIDFVPSPAFGLGPIVSYDLGRDASRIDDPVVARLGDIDGAIEAGGFAEMAFPVGSFQETPVLATARVSAVQAFGGHDGITGDVSAGLLVPGEILTVGVNVSAGFASEDSMQTLFGVSAAGSAASGLPVYSPGGGLKEVGAGVFASRKLDDNWSVNLIARYTRLVGDAADSPIVRQRGTEHQGFAGLGISYTFR